MKRLTVGLLAMCAFAYAEDCLPKEFLPSGNSRYEEYARERYASFLREMDEPCLYDIVRKQEPREVYRFQWSGSKQLLSTIIVRLEINSDRTGTAYIKTRKRQGMIPGKMPKDEIKQIPKEKIDPLFALLDAFWSMPYSDNIVGFDGTGWYLEGVSDGKFHAVYRWSPAKRQERFHQIGEYFLYEIAEVKVDHKYLD